MKKIMILAMLMVMTITANAMSYMEAKKEALYLSDKMAWELSLTDAQYDAVYEINLDYMMSVNGRNDVYGVWWKRRNTDLQYVLTAYQYNKYIGLSYFYRPLTWHNGYWTFNVYTHYSNKSHFYMAHPKGYASYKGGNNRKPANHYASKGSNGHGNGTAGRNTNKNNRNTAGKPNGHIAQMATLLRTRVKVTALGTLDADNSICSNICLATGHGESQEWGSLFGALF